MRRFVLTVLVFLIAFQTSWALAATYCLHERAKSAAHFGHHQHDHASATSGEAVDAPVDTADRMPSGGDPDCAACHAATPAVMLVPPAIVPSPPVRDHFLLAAPTPPPAPATRIERPDWSALA